jgi:hypothetical protein
MDEGVLVSCHSGHVQKFYIITDGSFRFFPVPTLGQLEFNSDIERRGSEGWASMSIFGLMSCKTSGIQKFYNITVIWS